MGVIESASRLFELLSSRDHTFTKYLTAGLPEQEIERLVEPTGIRLPAETSEFYRQFGVVKDHASREDQPKFYGGHWLLSLEEAVNELADWREIWYQFAPEERDPRDVGWLPFLQEDANLYVLDTVSTVEGRCTVLEFGEYDGPKPAFVSLEAMFDTLYHWVNEGVLKIENGGVAGYFEGDARRVVEIAARINPGLDFWPAWLEYKTNPPEYLR